MNQSTRYDPFTNAFSDSSTLQKERANQSIFVSIVSYEDKNIYDTLESLYSNALYPERLYVSVVMASRSHKSSMYPDIPDYPNIQPSFVGVDKSSNLDNDLKDENHNLNTYGKLKALANKKFNGETFYMTVGSSSRFDPNWDDVLLKYFQAIENVTGGKFVLTAFPRAYLDHEEVVEGFSYYTNHKQKISYQREDYDGATIPHSGFPDGYDSEEALSSMEGVQGNDEFKKFFFEFSEQQEFFKNRGYPKIFGKKFRRGEALHMANGISHDFLFGKAREVLKTNPSNENILDIHAENMLATLRFFKEKYIMYTMRWTPVYKLYDRPWMINRTSLKSLYEDFNSSPTEDQLHNPEIFLLIDKLKNSDSEEVKFTFNTFFGVDWEEKKYKIKTQYLFDPLSSLINTMASSYDFSVNENRLHWNKRSL
jgi:hypothetical protein